MINQTEPIQKTTIDLTVNIYNYIWIINALNIPKFVQLTQLALNLFHWEAVFINNINFPAK